VFVVKNLTSVVAIFETEEEATAKRKQLNTQYQTNEYYVETYRKAN